MKLLSLSNVEFAYKPGQTPVLDIPEWNVEKGEKIFLFGPSGSGKTTLLEMMAGILIPQKGSVYILGQDLTKLSSGGRDLFRAAHLGYIFQSFNLIPYLSVSENIALPFHLSSERRAHLDGKSLDETLNFLCERLGITQLREKKVTELSVGQQQRVAVARALLGKPELILADEPTSALDTDHREKFLKLLFELCKEFGSTLIFVSHDRGIEPLFDRSVSLASLQRGAK